MKTIGLAAVLALPPACSASDDGELGGGEQTGPLAACEPDPEGTPPISGHYRGRFAFSASDPVTFPIVVDLDLAAGTVVGELEFADARQAYAGTLEGSSTPDGSISASFEAVGDDDTVITGTVEGAFDGRGGCGSWANAAGQQGPWQVGELAVPTGLALEVDLPR